MTVSRRRPLQANGDPVRAQVFLSHAGEDEFEASLLQYAIEQMLADVNVIVWTYERDQRPDERNIGKSLKDRVRESKATIFLVSPSTLNAGAAQWMELAYADAYNVPTFIILHHLTFEQLKSHERGVPPLLLESQCNAAVTWKSIIESLRLLLTSRHE
jgi:TIR domain-containing protein